MEGAKVGKNVQPNICKFNQIGCKYGAECKRFHENE